MSSIYIVTKEEREQAAKEGKSVRDIVREREKKKREKKEKKKPKTIEATPHAAEIIEATKRSDYKGRVPEEIIEAHKSEVKVIPSAKPKEEVLLSPKAAQAIAEAPPKEQQRILKPLTTEYKIISVGQPVSTSATLTQKTQQKRITLSENYPRMQARSIYGEDYNKIPKDQRAEYENIASLALARERGIKKAYKEGRLTRMQARKEYANLRRDLERKFNTVPKEFEQHRAAFKLPSPKPKQYKDQTPFWADKKENTKYAAVEKELEVFNKIEIKMAEGTERVRSFVSSYLPDVKPSPLLSALFPGMPSVQLSSPKPYEERGKASQFMVSYVTYGMSAAPNLPYYAVKSAISLRTAVWSITQPGGFSSIKSELARPFTSSDERYTSFRQSFNPTTPEGAALYGLVSTAAVFKGKAAIAKRKAVNLPRNVKTEGFIEYKYSGVVKQPYGRATEILDALASGKTTQYTIKPWPSRAYESGTVGKTAIARLSNFETGESITRVTTQGSLGRSKVSYIADVPGKDLIVSTTYKGLFRRYNYFYNAPKQKITAPIVAKGKTTTAIGEKDLNIQTLGELRAARSGTLSRDYTLTYQTGQGTYSTINIKQTTLAMQKTTVKATPQLKIKGVAYQVSGTDEFTVIPTNALIKPGSKQGSYQFTIKLQGAKQNMPKLTEGALKPTTDTTKIIWDTTIQSGTGKLTAYGFEKTVASRLFKTQETGYHTFFKAQYNIKKLGYNWGEFFKSKKGSVNMFEFGFKSKTAPQTRLGVGRLFTDLTYPKPGLLKPLPVLGTSNYSMFNFVPIVGAKPTSKSLLSPSQSLFNQSTPQLSTAPKTRPKPKVNIELMSKQEVIPTIDRGRMFDFSTSQRQGQRQLPKPKQRTRPRFDVPFGGLPFITPTPTPPPRPPPPDGPTPPPPPPPNFDLDLDLRTMKKKKQRPKGRKKARKYTKYTPSLTAIGLNIKGPKPKGIYFGLRLRPILEGGSI